MKIVELIVAPVTGVTKRVLHLLIALLLSCIHGSVVSADPALPEIHFVPDVVDQFSALSTRPDALGFYKGDSPNPSRCKHYQGMVRYQGGDNTPYFIISRSGNTPPIPHLPDGISCGELNGGDDDDPGNLLVIRMGSREKHGERMRSNRIRKGKENADTPPEPEDRLATYITFDGTDGWPSYGHPGGMQIVGDVLAVPMETPYEDDFPEARILFIDVSTPDSPQLIDEFDPDIPGMKAGLLGLTPQASGKYLMLISGGTNETIWFYESNLNDDNGTPDNLEDDSANLKLPNLDWTLVDTWTKAEDEVDVGADWPIEGGAHQSLTFLREGGIDGQLYVAGARNTVVLQYFGEDYIDLYRVERTGDNFKLIREATSHKNTHPNSDGSITLPETPLNDAPTTANFATASTFYVSPTGELLFYASEHENDGATEDFFFGGTIKAGEWRHIDMARENSPTRSPTARTNGPYSVNEGSSVTVSGTGGPAISKAWIQLYSNRNYSGRYVVFDYSDRLKDNFRDFKDLDGDILDLKRGFDNIASSWNWYAPQGCTIRANDDSFGDGDFPGSNTRTLYGGDESIILRESDLRDVCNNSNTQDGKDCSGNNGQMDDELTSVEFFTNCDAYYNAELQFAWDLDSDSSIDEYNATADFSAAELDGPDFLEPQFLVIHPTDGSTGRAYAGVVINNVPPSIESFIMRDELGLEIGVDIPFVFVNLGLTALGSFTDPGKPDTQTALIDWKDSTTDPSTVFDIFTDAWGGVTGELEQQHIYSTPGTYSVHLNIVDDDGGSSDASFNVNVASPADALEFLVDELDQILSIATNPEYIAAILIARNKLAGNLDGSAENGALDKLANEEPRAALTMIEASLVSLQNAEIIESVDLNYLINILGLAAEAISQDVYLAAVAALAIPSKGEEKQLQRIRQSIIDGHALLLSGDHLEAITEFQVAVGRAIKLL